MTELSLPQNIKEIYKNLTLPAKYISTAMRHNIGPLTIEAIINITDDPPEVVNQSLNELINFGLVEKGRLIKGDKKNTFTLLKFIQDPLGKRYRLSPKYLFYILKEQLFLPNDEIEKEMSERHGEHWKELIS